MGTAKSQGNREDIGLTSCPAITKSRAILQVLPIAFSINIFFAFVLMIFVPWCLDNRNLSVRLDWQLGLSVSLLNLLDANLSS